MEDKITKSGGTSQLSKKSTLSLVEISKPQDLLKAKPICVQLREVNEVEILKSIRISIEKCAISLNIKLSEEQIKQLCFDLIEKFKGDSIEDIQQCLKKGRMAYYGFGHHSRTALTLHLISDWMIQHLDEKYQAKEAELKKHKEEFKEPLPNVDYEAYFNRVNAEEAEKRKARNTAMLKEELKKQPEI